MLNRPHRARHGQLGLSLVELMVGITIGLIVVAAASLLFSGQLAESRRLIAEAQVQQDLRASADIIARELRRGGALGRDASVHERVWTLGSAAEPAPNGYAWTISGVGTDDAVAFDYYPQGSTSSSTLTDGFGFRLDTARGVIEYRLFAGGSSTDYWQDLTDSATMQVTEFSVTRLNDNVTRVPCPKPCPPSGGTACWPTVNQRAFLIVISASHRTIPEVRRTHEARVRLRNDHFDFFSENADKTAGEVCPP
ncbi:MAG: PilW family protein [Betaproteobacteria bacterium]